MKWQIWGMHYHAECMKKSDQKVEDFLETIILHWKDVHHGRIGYSNHELRCCAHEKIHVNLWRFWVARIICKNVCCGHCNMKTHQVDSQMRLTSTISVNIHLNLRHITIVELNKLRPWFSRSLTNAKCECTSFWAVNLRNHIKTHHTQCMVKKDVGCERARGQELLLAKAIKDSDKWNQCKGDRANSVGLPGL